MSVGTGTSRRRAIPGSSLILFAVLIMFAVSGCTFQWSSMKPWDIATLKTRVSRDYPDWTIEKVYTHFSGGLGNGAEVAVLLKWPGPQDFRVRLYFAYNGYPTWTESLPSVFQNRRDAVDFITAFKARHPEPGLVVDDIQRVPLQEAGPRGLLSNLAYWNLADLGASDGGLAGFDAHVEQWRGTVSNDGIVWEYAGGH